MAGKRKKPQEPRAEAREEVGDARVTAAEQSAENAAAQQSIEPEKTSELDKFTLKPRPGYGGEINILPDGSMARKEDYGNDAGMFAQFIPPAGMDRPEPDVTEPLKEHRRGHSKFGYAKPDAPPKSWHKHLKGRGLVPAEERADGDDRFGKGLEARKKHAKDGHTR